MSDEYPELREAVAEAAFAALETAAEAGVWAALALYPDHPLDCSTPGGTAAVDAAHRVVTLAQHLIEELDRYRFITELDSDPDPF
jgi:hypothetical protein